MASLNDKVRKAKANANKLETSIAASETVSRNAKTAKVDLTLAQERAAKKIIQPRMQLDRSKTAARAAGIEKTQAKKTNANKIAAATGNVATSKPSKFAAQVKKDVKYLNKKGK
jgi:hypothetical protein